MKWVLQFCLAAMIPVLLAASPKPRLDKVLPEWRKGEMDLHFINSETGECLFCIFPDGTTMIVDAGETKMKPGANPKGNKPAYKIYSDYIGHFLPATGSDRIDYALLTHLHIDHFGDARCSYSNENGYAHMGMTALYDEIKYDKIVDRAYPFYGADTTIFFKTPDKNGNTSGCVGDWIGFVRHAVEQGCRAERFSLGSDSQFSLVKGGDGKYDFRVLNVVSNGECICKNGDEVLITEKAAVTSENAASCGIHISYGDFDFITCGDLTGEPQNLFAKYYLKTFNPSVELFKANHHLHHNAWGSGMRESGFRPDAVISFSWCKSDSKHFPVNMIEKVASFSNLYATAPKSAEEYPETFKKIKDYGGHFVVRVFKDGSYVIVKLSDNESDFIVRSIHGPYKSKAVTIKK